MKTVTATSSSRLPSRPALRRGALAGAAVLLAVCLAAPASLAEGLYYEATQTVDPEKGKEQTQWDVRAWVDGENARIEFSDSSNPMMKKGSWLLTTDGGRTMVMVDPEEQTWTRWDLDALFATFGALMEGMGDMFKLEFEDVSSETLADEAGPEILGYPTRHLRYTTAYTMKMKAMGMRREFRVESTTSAWATDAISAPGLLVWLRAAPPTTGDEDLDRMIREEASRLDGLALKVESTSRTTNKKGKTTTSTSLMQVTTLREESVDPERFAIPAGYTEAEPPETPSGLGDIFGRN